MTQKGLSGFFEKFIDEKTLFLNKKALQSTYMPEAILHREEQINQIAKILAPALKNEKPSNVFMYGKTGTGKTLTIKYVSQQLTEVAMKRKIPLKIIYLNCKLKKIADTEYRLVAQLIKEFGSEVPATGLPTDEVYNIFLRLIDAAPLNVILVLDEIDQLVYKAGDEIIYNLTRINSELKNTQITFVGISNSLVFTENMDPRVKSSLSQEEIIFPPYNAVQLQDILKKRAELAFKEGSIDSGVIQKCAAFAAREHGDARRALDLLRVAGELAERESAKNLAISHLDEAEEKIEKERIIEIIKTQPKQSQATLYSMLLLMKKADDQIYTGDVYDLYKDLCTKTDLRPLTQRRISDIIAELDMLGIITTHVVSKGRYGRTKEMTLGIPFYIQPKVKDILTQELGLKQ
jgi:archaeal cell division control protein 6